MRDRLPDSPETAGRAHIEGFDRSPDPLREFDEHPSRRDLGSASPASGPFIGEQGHVRIHEVEPDFRVNREGPLRTGCLAQSACVAALVLELDPELLRVRRHADRRGGTPVSADEAPRASALLDLDESRTTPANGDEALLRTDGPCDPFVQGAERRSFATPRPARHGPLQDGRQLFWVRLDHALTERFHLRNPGKSARHRVPTLLGRFARPSVPHAHNLIDARREEIQVFMGPQGSQARELVEERPGRFRTSNVPEGHDRGRSACEDETTGMDGRRLDPCSDPIMQAGVVREGILHRTRGACGHAPVAPCARRRAQPDEASVQLEGPRRTCGHA